MTDAVRQALEWYAAEAEALAKNTATGAHTQAVLASVTVLALDGGRKARAALSEQPATHPAPVERVALTDKLIDAATIRHWGRRSAPALADHRAYARAVIAEYERANGIGNGCCVKRYTAVTYREPVWAGQCRQCMHLRQYRGGRIWKCSVLTIARGVWRPAVGYCADARAPDGICGPHGRMFQAAQGKGEQA